MGGCYGKPSSCDPAIPFPGPYPKVKTALKQVVHTRSQQLRGEASHSSHPWPRTPKCVLILGDVRTKKEQPADAQATA